MNVGTMKGKNESIHPTFRNMMKIGIMFTWPGIIMVASITINKVSLPKKRSLAKPHPTMLLLITCPLVLKAGTQTVLSYWCSRCEFTIWRDLNKQMSSYQIDTRALALVRCFLKTTSHSCSKSIHLLLIAKFSLPKERWVIRFATAQRGFCRQMQICQLKLLQQRSVCTNWIPTEICWPQTSAVLTRSTIGSRNKWLTCLIATQTNCLAQEVPEHCFHSW